MVSATLAPTAANPTGAFQANVPAPTRDTEFSVRAAHQFGEKHSAYVQYSYQDWTGQNQGVGGQTLAAAGYNTIYHEDDFVAHVDSTLSAVTLNQLSLVGEHWSNRNQNVAEGPRISLPGDFLSGSAQADSFGTEYNFRLSEMVTWTHGRNLVKVGRRRAAPQPPRLRRQDQRSSAPTPSRPRSPPTASPCSHTGLPELRRQSSLRLLAEHRRHALHLSPAGDGRLHSGPGEGQQPLRHHARHALRLAELSRHPPAGLFAARLLCVGARTRIPNSFCAAEAAFITTASAEGRCSISTRYGSARRRVVILALDPATLPATGCVPITNCVTLTAQPPMLVELEPNAKIPYQIQYGLSIERQLGERATGTVSVYSMRGIDMFRSIDINAPTALSGYTLRPNPAYGIASARCSPQDFTRATASTSPIAASSNKYFTGFGRYTWSHYESNTGGIGWFPQNQSAPGDEWSTAGFDRRQRLGMYAIFNQKSLFNIAAGTLRQHRPPWTILTGADPYGDDLFNARPEGVGRNIRDCPVLRRSRSALGPRLRHHRQQGRRSTPSGNVRSGIQHPQSPESL